MMPHLRWLAAPLLVATFACHRGPPRAAPDAQLLTQSEMQDGHFTNVYDAVASLRANWLTVRGTDSFFTPSEVMVYFDDTRLGGVSELRGVTVNSAAWARHYNGVDATTRWGVGHSAGVILISSRR
jgi:hypothetical protein